MIWHLTKKETLSKILDLRFIISCIIALSLIILSTVILSEQYLKQLAEYNEAIKNNEEALAKVKTYSQLSLNISRQPNPLSIFNSGLSDKLDNTMKIIHEWVPRKTLETRKENPFMDIFQIFDLSTIFQIVLSLLAILFVYDSICGEREQGTLKLTLGNSVGRYQVLVSKVLASFIGLAIPILLSFIISFLIIIIFYNIHFALEQWIRIGLVMTTTFLFLGIFITVGLFVSSMVRNASTSLIWLLFLWIVMVIVQPNLGSYIASSIIPIPSREKIDSAIEQVCDQFDEQEQRINEEINTEVGPNRWWSYCSMGGAHYYCYDGNRDGLRYFLFLTRKLEPVRIEHAQREWQVFQSEYLSFLDKQLIYQNLIDKFSPVAIFKHISAIFSQTDINSYESFLEQARNYRQTYLTYLQDDKKIFSDHANYYFSRLTLDQIENNDFEERNQEAERTGNDKLIHKEQDYAPLDLADLPKFKFKTVSLIKSVQTTLLDLSILIFISIILFFLATINFNRYDIRS